MGVIYGSVESLWLDKANDLHGPSEVQPFVERLTNTSGLDKAVLYLMIEARYYAKKDYAPLQTTIFFELLRSLGEKRYSEKGNGTVLQAAEQRKRNSSELLPEVLFSTGF